jgi:hypothetical protein
MSRRITRHLARARQRQICIRNQQALFICRDTRNNLAARVNDRSN